MKNTMFTRIVAVLAVLCMVATCFVACGGSSYTSNNEKYVIGFTGPLSGPTAMYGEAVKNSAQMAVDEINAAGGLNGIEFELVAMDDTHDATKVAGLYSTLLEGGMQVSLGTVTSAPALEFKNYSEEDNVFFLTPSASADAVPANPNG